MAPYEKVKTAGSITEPASSAESTPPGSRVNSSTSLKDLDHGDHSRTIDAGRKTLASRSKIPYSMYTILCLVVGAQWSGGIYSVEVFQSVCNSLATSANSTWNYLAYLRDLTRDVVTGQSHDPVEIFTAAFASICTGCCLYVLLYVPIRAGMWTGTRARRHKVHRYMGLLFLIQYFAAWVEYIASYDQGGKDSYLSHFVSMNGVIQGVSAYFSFKVLPELADPGYYSDKAVLSRSFVHENTFFTTITFLGSCLYHDTIRTNMMAHPVGRIIMFLLSYWMYCVVRPLFPITSFSNAGSRQSGRTAKNEEFYRVGTRLVKFFYLWAKYFLGFVLNWVVYLGLASEKDMFFVRGLYLLNVGTVSISVFLHTLRFKKALPPTLTFSIYLGQIYCSFLALPYCYSLFSEHKMLVGLGVLGLVVNMKRNRYYHAVWCGLCACLLEFTDIEW